MSQKPAFYILFVLIFFISKFIFAQNIINTELPKNLKFASSVLAKGTLMQLNPDAWVLLDYEYYSTHKKFRILLFNQQNIVQDTLLLDTYVSAIYPKNASVSILTTDFGGALLTVDNNTLKIKEEYSSNKLDCVFIDSSQYLFHHTTLEKKGRDKIDIYFRASHLENKIALLSSYSYTQKEWKTLLSPSSAKGIRNRGMQDNELSFLNVFENEFKSVLFDQRIVGTYTLPDTPGKWMYSFDPLKKRHFFIRYISEEQVYAFYMLDKEHNRLFYVMDTPHFPIQFYGDSFFYRDIFAEENEGEETNAWYTMEVKTTNQRPHLSLPKDAIFIPLK